MIRRPSDAKLASFGKTRVKKVFLRLGMRTFSGVSRFPFMEGDDPTFPEGERFLPLKVGEVGSYCGKGDLFPLCITVFHIGIILGTPSYLVGGDEVNS